MSTSRLAQLEAFLAESPDDPFVHYGLALEYRNAERFDDARRMFAGLLDRFADYVPTYYQYGMMLYELGEEDDALSTLRKGLEVAQAAGDTHAVAETERAIEDIEDEI